MKPTRTPPSTRAFPPLEQRVGAVLTALLLQLLLTLGGLAGWCRMSYPSHSPPSLLCSSPCPCFFSRVLFCGSQESQKQHGPMLGLLIAGDWNLTWSPLRRHSSFIHPINYDWTSWWGTRDSVAGMASQLPRTLLCSRPEPSITAAPRLRWQIKLIFIKMK